MKQRITHSILSVFSDRDLIDQLKMRGMFEAPRVYAQFEVVEKGWTGTKEVPVKRVEIKDDGTATVIIDYWPEEYPQSAFNGE